MSLSNTASLTSLSDMASLTSFSDKRGSTFGCMLHMLSLLKIDTITYILLSDVTTKWR